MPRVANWAATNVGIRCVGARHNARVDGTPVMCTFVSGRLAVWLRMLQRRPTRDQRLWPDEYASGIALQNLMGDIHIGLARFVATVTA